MKDIRGLTYYEILNIPADASSVEINRAYRDAKALYGDDALDTYMLFSKEERARILETIETAFTTLIDKKKKEAYDKQLSEIGVVHGYAAADPGSRSQEPDLISQNRARKNEVLKKIAAEGLKSEYQRLADEIQSRESITGEDLRMLRRALGVDLFDVYAVTTVSVTMLKALENDNHEDLPSGIVVKTFLKAYAELLQLNPQILIDAYFKSMSNNDG